MQQVPAQNGALPPATPRAPRLGSDRAHVPHQRRRPNNSPGLRGMGLTPHINGALEMLDPLSPLPLLVRREAERMARERRPVTAQTLYQRFAQAGLHNLDPDEVRDENGDEMLD